ncbi:hypothetical protein [Dactylosporangium sp. NPDC049140]|uniref:hypothetical protein n=1 Tax=Dactylosporangium sp. NPDC049140 TaxID=3155647 RepID=UPI0033D9D1BB
MRSPRGRAGARRPRRGHDLAGAPVAPGRLGDLVLAVTVAITLRDALQDTLAGVRVAMDGRLGAEPLLWLGHGFDGVEQSEGQWQKVALARASMRRDPLLFVLDEPTASLDVPSEHAIFERYMARARALAARTGAVTVIVSHRFSTVAGADLILVLDRGRLVEQGAHEELLAAGGRYAVLYAIQATAYTG